MKFLADEGVDKPIVDLLRQSGFDVHYILETNRGAEDEQVLSIANREERILLTQDKDFGELIYRLKKVHPGIILIRLGTTPASQKGTFVNNVLKKHSSKLLNAFTVIQANAVRIRKHSE
jgi:predicted nuclease of predicted toxin-antitoxin system